MLLGYEEALWTKNRDKSSQSNFDKRSSDFGSFLIISLLLWHEAV